MCKDESCNKPMRKREITISRRIFWLFCVLSACLWLIPFFFRIFYVDFVDPKDFGISPKTTQSQAPNVISQVICQLDEGHKFSAFGLIFWNNLKVCILNIAGGAMLSIMTIINLLKNGLFTGNILSSVYHNGMDISVILKHTLPHSIELLGTWLSGAIGFNFTKIIIDYMRGKGVPEKRHVKFLVTNTLVVLFITFFSAFIEVYVSMSIYNI